MKCAKKSNSENHGDETLSNSQNCRDCIFNQILPSNRRWFWERWRSTNSAHSKQSHKHRIEMSSDNIVFEVIVEKCVWLHKAPLLVTRLFAILWLFFLRFFYGFSFLCWFVCLNCSFRWIDRCAGWTEAANMENNVWHTVTWNIIHGPKCPTDTTLRKIHCIYAFIVENVRNATTIRCADAHLNHEN